MSIKIFEKNYSSILTEEMFNSIKEDNDGWKTVSYMLPETKYDYFTSRELQPIDSIGCIVSRKDIGKTFYEILKSKKQVENSFNYYKNK